MASGILTQRVTNTEQLASWVQEIITRERLRYRPTWVQWLKNLLAFHGENFKEVGDDLKLLPKLSDANKKFLGDVNANFISPHVRTVANKLQKARPILECIPSTTDESDILSAKVGDRLLKGEWFGQDMDTLRIELAMWTCTTGNSFLHTYFDSNRGQYLDNGLFTGQIASEVLNPFKVIFEPNRLKIQDCRWCVIRQRLPNDQIQELYEKLYFERTKKNLVIPTGGTGDPDDVADTYLEVIGLGKNNIPDEEFVDVDTLYHLPSKWYPEGRYAVLVGSEVLYVGPYPYPFLGRLPIVHFREILAPWRLYGETQTSEVLKAQDLYLKMRTIERNYHAENCRSLWMKPKRTRVRRKSMTNSSDRIIEWEGEEPPKREQGLNIPSTFYQTIDNARLEIQRAGMSDATMSAPEGSPSGRAVLALQEQDDSRLGLTCQLMEVEYGRWGQNVLQMAHEFYSEPRKYAAAGDALQGGVWFFDKADLGQTTDVRCVAGSGLPMNKLAKQETVEKWLKMGVLGNNPDEAIIRARRMLEIGMTDDIYDDDALDQQVAEKENIWMTTTAKQILAAGIEDQAILTQELMGAVMPVSPIDNHLIHIKVLLRRAKAPGVRDNAMILGVLVQHYELHMMQMQGGQQPPQPGQPGAAPQATPEQPGQPTQPALQESPSKVAGQAIGTADISKGAIDDAS